VRENVLTLTVLTHDMQHVYTVLKNLKGIILSWTTITGPKLKPNLAQLH
jgi:hypothetical protein